MSVLGISIEDASIGTGCLWSDETEADEIQSGRRADAQAYPVTIASTMDETLGI